MGVPIGDVHDFSRYPPNDLIALLVNPFEKRYGQIARVLELSHDGFRLRFGYDPSSGLFNPQEGFFCNKYHRDGQCGGCAHVPFGSDIPPTGPLLIFNGDAMIFNEHHGYLALLDELSRIDMTAYITHTGRELLTVVEDYATLWEEHFIGDFHYDSSDFRTNPSTNGNTRI